MNEKKDETRAAKVVRSVETECVCVCVCVCVCDRVDVYVCCKLCANCMYV